MTIGTALVFIMGVLLLLVGLACFQSHSASDKWIGVVLLAASMASCQFAAQH